MKRNFNAVILITAAVFILSACGNKGDDQDKASEEVTVQTEAGDAEVTDETEASSEEQAAMIPEAEAEPVYDGAAPVNNGGHFVRYKDRVYFHVPDEDGMKMTGLFGEYFSGEHGTTKLLSFHTDTLETEEIMGDHSFGGIGITGDHMYMDEFVYEDQMSSSELGVYDMTKDFASSNIPLEVYMAAAKDGSAVVTGIFDGDHEGYILHVHCADGSEYTVEDDRIQMFVVCDKDRLFYSTYDYNTNSYRLFGYEYADGSKTFLGDIPTPKEESSAEGPGEIDGTVIDGDGVFFAVNYFEGTGHFLSDSYLVSAYAGKEGSLTYKEATRGDDPERKPQFKVSGGSIDETVDGTPLTAEVTAEGDLVYYDENGKQQKIENITPGAYATVSDDEGNMKSNTECVEYLDGVIFGIRNELERVPEEDIGWRMAYRRTKTTVFAVYTDTGKEIEVCTVEGGSGSDASKTSDDAAAEDSASENSAAEDSSEGTFTSSAIPDNVFARMEGVSFPADCTISRDDLRYLRLSYHDFNGNSQVGELVCNKKVADDMVEIFRELYKRGYQIEKMKLIDDYGGDDDLSCADNNTSCFNYRTVAGSTNLSKHALGVAIDINPFYNPYVTYPNGVERISPPGSEPYADRSADFPHKIGPGDDAYELFKAKGYTWGGNWKTLKDYQHFQKG